jgi:hypothetical protein
MFNFTKRDKRTTLEKEIDAVLDILKNTAPDSTEYAAIAKNLEMLCKAKSHEHCRGISPDTIAAIAGNLLGIVLILGYEKANVITSKALGFVIRGRV